MSRLKHGGIIFLSADKKVCGVYLSHVQNRVHGDLDYNLINARRGNAISAEHALKSAMALTVTVWWEKVR